MKIVALFVFCLSSLSLYGSNRPALEELKRGVLNKRSEMISDDNCSDEEYETLTLEEKYSSHIETAQKKVAQRGHTPTRRNSREIIENR